MCKCSEFNESLKYGNVIEFFYKDNYVNLFDYDNPSDHYIETMENTLELNYLSTNYITFSPFSIKTNKGIIFNRIDKKYLYEFDVNDVSILPKHPGEENIFMNYNIKLNNKVKTYERRYKKLQEVFAEIGGLIEVIICIAAFVVKFYNEYIILRHTRKIISYLYYKNQPMNNQTVNSYMEFNNNNNNNTINNININTYNNETMPNSKSNHSMNKLKENQDLNVKDDKSDVANKGISSSISQPKIENDNNTVFTEENQDIGLCSYLIHRITCSQTYKKYNIYKEFREKIFVDEQIIKNHVTLFNLVNKNKPTSTIYSLRELINSE